MIDNPLVSVVVPVYNVEKYLDRCVQSVVNQTYENLEIILVDDGSTDKSAPMCDNWAKADSRIKVVHKKNSGLGMARNTGLESACGKYIFFFDSDDYVNVETVEKCVATAEKNNSEVVIYGLCDVYDDGKISEKEIVTDKTVFVGDEVKNEVLPGMFTYSMGFGISSCGKMYSLKKIKELSLKFKSEKEIVSEDAYFILELFPHINNVSVIKESLYYYYKRSNSLTHSYKADRQKKNDIFLVRCIELANQNNLSQDVTDHITARYHMYSISAMKQIAASDLSAKEKELELNMVMKSKVLHDSLTGGALRLHNKKLKLFYVFLKHKCYFACKLLLLLKRN